MCARCEKLGCVRLLSGCPCIFPCRCIRKFSRGCEVLAREVNIKVVVVQRVEVSVEVCRVVASCSSRTGCPGQGCNGGEWPALLPLLRLPWRLELLAAVPI